MCSCFDLTAAVDGLAVDGLDCQVGAGGGERGLLTGGISDNLFLENNLFKNQADLN